MGIKSIEYQTKWAEQIGLVTNNKYRPKEGQPAAGAAPEANNAEGHKAAGEPAKVPESEHQAQPLAKTEVAPAKNPEYVDPNANTPDAAKITPIAQAPPGLAPKVVEQQARHVSEEEQE